MLLKRLSALLQRHSLRRLGELQTYIHNLFTRVRAQHEQLHDDFKQNVEESFDAFRDSIQRHLEQLFGSVPVQIEGLS